MQKRIIFNKGKKFIVNCAGGDEGIGNGCSDGVVWLQDENGAWYSVQLTGLQGSLSFVITAIPTANQSVGMNANDFGFQLVQANDGEIYQVSINSTLPSVVISQTPSDYQSSKPFLFLQSNTDQAYYYINAINTTGTISLSIDDASRINGTLVTSYN